MGRLALGVDLPKQKLTEASKAKVGRSKTMP